MRTLYRGLILVFIIMVLGFGAYSFKKDTDINKNLPPIPPVPDKSKYKFTLYFGNQDNNRLVGEPRIIVSEEQMEEKIIIEELIKGPRNKILKPSIPPETNLISIETVDGICYVNFSRRFLDTYRWERMNEAITIWSIVNSLTQLDHIQAVQILVEGKKVGIIEKYYSLKEPFYRNEELMKKEIVTPSDTFYAFLEYLKGSNYEKAYQLLDKSSQTRVEFVKFKINMGGYIRELRDYEISNYHTQKFSNKVVLIVTFKKRLVSIEGSDDQFKESWEMMNENGTWKIIMPI